MKKHLMALSAFAVIAIAANAQATGNESGNAGKHQSTPMHHKQGAYGRHPHHRNDMLMKLDLTGAQKEQARALNTEYKNQLKELEKNDAITLKDYRAKKASLEQQRKSKFENILTPEQKDKLAKAKKESSEKRAAMAEKRLEKMKADLNLSDEQVAKIKEQQEQSMARAKAIRENPSLTDEQKKEEFMNLAKSRKESMNSILTTDQVKKKEEMRNNRINDMKNKRANKDS